MQRTISSTCNVPVQNHLYHCNDFKAWKVCVCLSVLVFKPHDLISTTFTHCFSKNLKLPQVSI